MLASTWVYILRWESWSYGDSASESHDDVYHPRMITYLSYFALCISEETSSCSNFVSSSFQVSGLSFLHLTSLIMNGKGKRVCDLFIRTWELLDIHPCHPSSAHPPISLTGLVCSCGLLLCARLWLRSQSLPLLHGRLKELCLLFEPNA
jgi:hypothetical protein